MKVKVELYILSLWLLFLLILIVKADLPICFNDCTFIGFGELIARNVIPSVALLFWLAGAVFYWRFKYRVVEGAKLLPFQIKSIENINYDHLTFLSTYIIPLICFDLDKERYAIALGMLLLIIGIIYVRTNLFYANPTLAVLGFRIYRVSTIKENNIILISLDELKVSDWVHQVRISENVYFVKLKRNEQNGVN